MSAIQEHYYAVVRKLRNQYIDMVHRTIRGKGDPVKIWAGFDEGLETALKWADLTAAAKLRYRALHERTDAPQSSLVMVMDMNPWYAEHASATAPEISNRARIISEIERNYYVKQSQNKRKPMDERVPEHRIERVYRQSLAEVHEVSQQAQLSVPAVGAAFPFCMYNTREDARVRPTHAAMDGFIALRTHDIWETIRPLNGWGCRCGLRMWALFEARREGWLKKDDTPRFEIKWPNSASKRNYEAGIFPDPGWQGPKFVAR